MSRIATGRSITIDWAEGNRSQTEMMEYCSSAQRRVDRGLRASAELKCRRDSEALQMRAARCYLCQVYALRVCML